MTFVTEKFHNINDIYKLFFGYLLLFSAIYMPALIITYGFHNDFSIFDLSVRDHPGRSCCFLLPESVHLFLIGRPSQALLLNLSLLPISDLGDLRYGRAVAVLLMSLAATMLASLFSRSTSVGRPGSFVVVALIFVLPGAQVFVFWFMNLLPGAFNLVLAIGAAVLADQIAPALLENRRILRRVGWRLLAVGLLLVLSFTIYPATTPFFLVPALARLLFRDNDEWDDSVRSAIRDLLLFLSAAAIYYFLHRNIIIPLAVNVIWPGVELPSGIYEFSLTVDPIRKFFWFLIDYSPAALRLWDVELRPWSAPMAASVILSGASLAALRILVCDRRWRGLPWKKVMLACVLLVCVNMPQLAARGDVLTSYRILLPYTTMFLLLVTWATREVWFVAANRAPKLMVIATMAAAILGSGTLAYRNVHGVALTAQTQFQYLRESLASEFGPNTKNIVIIEPARRRDLGERLTFEFDMMIGPSPGLARLATREVGGDPNQLDSLLFRKGTADFYAPSNAAVVDLHGAWPTSFPVGERARLLGTVASDANSGCCPVGWAFDGSEEGWSFWETDGPWPIRVSWEYEQETPLIGYALVAGDWGTLGAGELVKRLMPRRFRLEGWTLDAGWQLLDERTDDRPWQLGERRIYTLPTPATHRSFRLTFLEGNGPVLRIYEIQPILERGSITGQARD